MCKNVVNCFLTGFSSIHTKGNRKIQKKLREEGRKRGLRLVILALYCPDTCIIFLLFVFTTCVVV